MHRPRWMALVLGAAAIAVTAYVLLRPRVEHVWEGVAALPETVNTPGWDDHAPSITPDGESLVFTREKAGRDADLFVAPLRDGDGNAAAPIASINTEYDEVGGMLGTDGNLYFYSDRTDSLGGYDLYAAPRLPDGSFGTPTHLGANVNSSFNDCDPCLSHDGTFLFFSSNRGSAGAEANYDLYVCFNKAGEWTPARPVEALNTEHNERAPMVDRSGRILYFTSNRPRMVRGGKEQNDYDLYAATLHGRGWGRPRNLGAHINSADDERDPCVSPTSDRLFYVRGTRSGTAYDVSIWEGGRCEISVGPILLSGRMSSPVLDLIALLVAGLLLFLLLVYCWHRLTTLQKCLLGSGAIHCLVVWVFSLVTLRLAPDELGQADATFIIYADLFEDIQQEAFVTAMFEDKRPMPVSETPHRPADIPDVVPDVEPWADVSEREIARPEPQPDSMEWQTPPADLTDLTDTEWKAQEVSEAINDKVEDASDVPIDAPPLPDLSDLVAEQASLPPESVNPETFSAEIAEVKPAHEDTEESRKLAAMAMLAEDPSQELEDAAEEAGATIPQREETPLKPVEVAEAPPQEQTLTAELTKPVRPDSEGTSPPLTAPDEREIVQLAALTPATDSTVPSSVDEVASSPGAPSVPSSREAPVGPSPVPAAPAIPSLPDEAAHVDLSTPRSDAAQFSGLPNSGARQELATIDVAPDGADSRAVVTTSSADPDLPVGPAGVAQTAPVAPAAESASVSTVRDTTGPGASSAPPSRSAPLSRLDDRAGAVGLAELQGVQEGDAVATPTGEQSVTAAALPSAPAGAAGTVPVSVVAKSASVSTVSGAADPVASSSPPSRIAQLSRSGDRAGAVELAELQGVQEGAAVATPTGEQSMPSAALPSAPAGAAGTVPVSVVAKSASVSTVSGTAGHGVSSAPPSRGAQLSRSGDRAGVVELAELQAVPEGELGVTTAGERPPAGPALPEARLAVPSGVSVGAIPQIGLPSVAVVDAPGGAAFTPSASASDLVTPDHSVVRQVVELAASESPGPVQSIASPSALSPRIPVNTPRPPVSEPAPLLTPADSIPRPGVVHVGIDDMSSQTEKTAAATIVPGGRVARIAWGQASNLGAAVNSADDELDPSQSADGLKLFLTRESVASRANIYVSPMAEHGWDPPTEFPELNTPADEIGAKGDASGRLIVFCSDRPAGVGGYDLYMSEMVDGKWQTPTGLGTVVNSEYDDCSPCLSHDGQWLFFSSNRDSKGSEEDYDLYECRRTGGGGWGEPVRLLISTGSNDREPALSADGLSLYFSSNRAGGAGGYDIWMSGRLGDQWMPPANLGGGVNTEYDERDPAMTLDGTTLLFTSDRDGGEGGVDIWEAKRTLVMGE